MIKLTTIRHAETDANEQDIILGQIDWGLNKNGLNALKLLLMNPYFETHKFDFILSSPLLRARQTAEAIADKLKLKIKFIEEIKERDFGELSGLTWNDFSKRYPELAVLNTPSYQPNLPHGETIAEVELRVNKFIDKLKKDYANSSVLVVTHTGIIRILKRLLDNQNPEQSRQSDPDNLGISEFSIN